MKSLVYQKTHLFLVKNLISKDLLTDKNKSNFFIIYSFSLTGLLDNNFILI